MPALTLVTVKRKENPLKPQSTEEKDGQEIEAANPLQDDIDDPLMGSTKVKLYKQTAFTSTAVLQSAKSKKKTIEASLDWEIVGREILQEYTTNKDIPIISKIVDDVEDTPEVMTLTEKAKKRLAEMEEEEEAQKEADKMNLMSQKELIHHLETLATDLETAWNKGEKVKSLRIVIQSCKLLANCKVPAAYPSLFVLVSKVLDCFGSLVFQRIKNKSEFEERGGKQVQVLNLGDSFRCHDIPDDAKEMCKNWFYKIASIRELLPRVYVELCLWPCQRFLVDFQQDSQFNIESMKRFIRQVRGMGDPVTANYARLYLLRKANEVFQGSIPVESAVQCWDDWLTTRTQFESQKQRLAEIGLGMPEFLHLFTPSVQWIISVIGENADEALFQQVVKQYLDDVQQCNVLRCIIAGFKPALISKYVDKFIEWIKECEEGILKKTDCYLALGAQLVKTPPSQKRRLRVLNTVWEEMTEVEDPKRYVPVATVWLEYVVKHCDERVITILLEDIVNHIGRDKFSEDLEKYVSGIISILMNHLTNLSDLFQFDQFLPLVDLLTASTKTELCKNILTTFAAGQGVISDPIFISSMLDVCRIVHDDSKSEQIEGSTVCDTIISPCPFLHPVFPPRL